VTADDKPRREAILDLAKYVDQKVHVKFSGGREVTGTLKGFDLLLNLVMDDIDELLKDPDTGIPYDPPRFRSLGLAVLRGTSVVLINPANGSNEIENPFLSTNT